MGRAKVALRVGDGVMNNRVKALRTARKWTQREFAERLGISRQSVHAIETQKYDPSLPLAFKIAGLFETTIEDIFEHRTN